jgi:hypothetical protein
MQRLATILVLLFGVLVFTPDRLHATPTRQAVPPHGNQARAASLPANRPNLLDLLKHVWAKTGGTLDPFGGLPLPPSPGRTNGERGSGAGIETGRAGTSLGLY